MVGHEILALGMFRVRLPPALPKIVHFLLYLLLQKTFCGEVTDEELCFLRSILSFRKFSRHTLIEVFIWEIKYILKLEAR